MLARAGDLYRAVARVTPEGELLDVEELGERTTPPDAPFQPWDVVRVHPNPMVDYWGEHLGRYEGATGIVLWGLRNRYGDIEYDVTFGHRPDWMRGRIFRGHELEWVGRTTEEAYLAPVQPETPTGTEPAPPR
jgi:hypothetical protein